MCYNHCMEYKNIITLDPNIRGGQPTIRGMRITVYDILKMLASGMSSDDIVRDYPELTKKDIQAALMYASERERPQTIVTNETSS